MAADPIITELAIIRQARGLTRSDVAVAAGISVGSIYASEHGRATPRIDLLRDWATALDVDIQVVRPGDDTTRPSDMDADALADALTRLVTEAAQRLTETEESG